ncbi:unnamed protein product [Moneuplotes crassus]|uniref:Uncharacterized protein n=1 Tax=Euplotes crassus TaxID=5936 RepID=A0AAD1UIK1_EUPCR|nr:unnamed protein product [Moneuplotes crassus]
MMVPQYSLHNFCFCDYPNSNLCLQDIYCTQVSKNKPSQLGCSTNGTGEVCTVKEFQTRSSTESIRGDIQEPLSKEAFEKFLSNQITSGCHMQLSPMLNLSKKQMKKTERDFTNSNARKDVIYKAILRFFRRNCQIEIKRLECSMCSHQPDSLCCHTEEKSTVFLSSELGIPVTAELLEIFEVIISFGSTTLSRESPVYEFTRLFKTCMEKFNRKKLHKILSNKYFAIILLKFWERSELFEKMVRCLNMKREQEINVEAHRYYLHKLMRSCTDTLEVQIS